MENIMKKIVGIVSIIVFAAACNEVPGVSSLDNEQNVCCAETASIENVTAEELEGLTFMVEEEKLARDVYITLYSKWGQKVFNNISNSEQKHMDAVHALLDLYEQDIPSTLFTVGAFENDDLQTLYNDLVNQGSASLVEALKVGALIEEVDIVDLVALQNEVVQEEAIAYVYDNLIKGSENHLRSFVKNLGNQGVVYTPQLLDADTYNNIVN